MICPYESESHNCQYKTPENHCEFEGREWGCAIARHYEIEQRMINTLKQDFKNLTGLEFQVQPAEAVFDFRGVEE